MMDLVLVEVVGGLYIVEIDKHDWDILVIDTMW
jgi:hypothetical protein